MSRVIQKTPYSSTKTARPTTYLYTKGGEFSLNGENYIGEYHQLGANYRTGPIPDVQSLSLTRYYSNKDLYDYDRARNFKQRIRVEPDQFVFYPKQSDYESGFAKRYFVERSGAFEGYPIEIDKTQKITYGKEGGIDEAAYSLVTLEWKLTGYERSIYRNGEVYIIGIYEHNLKEVVVNSRIIPNLMTAIKSYTEFARVTLK